MNELPDDVWFQIFSLCDFPTLVRLRQVNRRFYDITNYLLYFKRKLVIDYSGEINRKTEKIRVNDADILLQFLSKFTNNLTEITIGMIPIRITMASLIQLASAHPKLETLKFEQVKELPIIEKDSLYALPYFKKLKHLKLKGWHTVDPKVRRVLGCAHRTDMLPFRGLIPLQTLIIECQKDTVANVLQEMRRNLVFLSNLKHIELLTHLSHVDLPGLLAWFLQSHCMLEKIYISGFLFASEAQVQRLYRSILSLPQLQVVYLNNCKAIAALDKSIGYQYLSEAFKLRIGAEGTVTSLRFVPEESP
ncbi:unnamed protein product [Auanema sp. JU1783]|nr:unnamed protein product [Auanema sp. JU1783]